MNSETLASLLPPKGFEPLHYTKPLSTRTRGKKVQNFIENSFTLSRGFRAGERMLLTCWQEWLMESVFEERADGFLRYRRVLIGLPRKNGKSLIGSGIAIENLVFSKPGDEIYSAARDSKQARIVFEEVCRQIRGNPILREILEVRADYVKNRFTGAIYRPLSADAMSAQGLAPSTVIFDEIHALGSGRGEEMWSALTEGSGDRPESLLIGITTAGSSTESLLGQLYTHGVQLGTGSIEDNAFGMFWWGSHEDDDIFSRETWLKANPNLRLGLMDETDFQSSLRIGTPAEIASFERYRLNRWVRSDGKFEFITSSQLSKSRKKMPKIPKGSEICVGFDGSISDDSTAFVAIDVRTGQMEILALWERDYSNPDWSVPRDEVLQAKRRIFKEYKVLKMWTDPAFFRTDVDLWVREHPGVVDVIPQSLQRMVPLTKQFKIDLLAGKLCYNDDVLAKYILNAVENDNGKISKESKHSKNKIDALVCAILANGARNVIVERMGRKPARIYTGNL